jgi:hypothetical protein
LGLTGTYALPENQAASIDAYVSISLLVTTPMNFSLAAFFEIKDL